MNVLQESSDKLSLPEKRQPKGVQPKSSIPELGVPVLALVSYTNSLGSGTYYEVIYHNGESWESYSGSDTFKDGESVEKWIYSDECL